MTTMSKNSISMTKLHGLFEDIKLDYYTCYYGVFKEYSEQFVADSKENLMDKVNDWISTLKAQGIRGVVVPPSDDVMFGPADSDLPANHVRITSVRTRCRTDLEQAVHWLCAMWHDPEHQFHMRIKTTVYYYTWTATVPTMMATFASAATIFYTFGLSFAGSVAMSAGDKVLRRFETMDQEDRLEHYAKKFSPYVGVSVINGDATTASTKAKRASASAGEVRELQHKQGQKKKEERRVAEAKRRSNRASDNTAYNRTVLFRRELETAGLFLATAACAIGGAYWRFVGARQHRLK